MIAVPESAYCEVLLCSSVEIYNFFSVFFFFEEILCENQGRGLTRRSASQRSESKNIVYKVKSLHTAYGF